MKIYFILSYKVVSHRLSLEVFDRYFILLLFVVVVVVACVDFFVFQFVSFSIGSYLLFEDCSTTLRNVSTRNWINRIFWPFQKIIYAYFCDQPMCAWTKYIYFHSKNNMFPFFWSKEKQLWVIERIDDTISNGN